MLIQLEIGEECRMFVHHFTSSSTKVLTLPLLAQSSAIKKLQHSCCPSWDVMKAKLHFWCTREVAPTCMYFPNSLSKDDYKSWQCMLYRTSRQLGWREWREEHQEHCGWCQQPIFKLNTSKNCSIFFYQWLHRHICLRNKCWNNIKWSSVVV